MNYAKRGTSETCDALPTQVTNPDGSITYNLTFDNYWKFRDWRKIVEIQQPAEGFRMDGLPFCEEIDDEHGRIIYNFPQINLAVEQMEQAAQEESAIVAIQTNKPTERKQAENAYLSMCDQLTGSLSHVKLGFVELETIIKNLPQEQQVFLAVNLLKLNAELQRLGGLGWWDDCTWHNGIV